MFCPKCGKENPGGAKFCKGCGKDISAFSSKQNETTTNNRPKTRVSAGTGATNRSAPSQSAIDAAKSLRKSGRRADNSSFSGASAGRGAVAVSSAAGKPRKMITLVIVIAVVAVVAIIIIVNLNAIYIASSLYGGGIVSGGGIGKGPTVTMAEMTKAKDDDMRAAAKKYEFKNITLTGYYLETFDPGGIYEIWLGSIPDQDITKQWLAKVPVPRAEAEGLLNVGDEVTVTGYVTSVMDMGLYLESGHIKKIVSAE